MPANLSPDFKEAERLFREAKTPDDKLAALKRMLSTIPKHKGTEKLQADIKRRIARVNDDLRHQERKKGFAVRVEREGAGQVVLVGPPNAGKSRLAVALTGVDLEVAPYPYSTQMPAPAMMAYEDIRIQLVDLPPVSSAHFDSWMPNILRTADAALLVADLSSPDVLDDTEDSLAALETRKIRLVGGGAVADPWASVAEKNAMLVGTKVDLRGAEGSREVLAELYGDRFEMHAVSSETGEHVPKLRERIYHMLGLVRVYSKPPGREPDHSKPFVLLKGSTVMDFARTVHHDFGDRLKFARVWGRGKFDGQRVNKDYAVGDGDVIELHT